MKNPPVSRYLRRKGLDPSTGRNGSSIRCFSLVVLRLPLFCILPESWQSGLDFEKKLYIYKYMY